MPESSLLARLYRETRARTLEIVSTLEIEDYVIQTADFMSPPRWHLGHTTWFFEMLLLEFHASYKTPYSQEFLYFFNSYYEKFGERMPRGRRGTRSRPTVRATLTYRSRVDAAMLELLEKHPAEPYAAERMNLLVRMGIEHEMQHQELLVWDIKHLLCEDYALPWEKMTVPKGKPVSGSFACKGGVVPLGYSGSNFSWDNERPQHKVYAEDFEIDRSPVTVGDYLEFIQAGGYIDFRLWLNDGLKTARTQDWKAPLYWEMKDGEWVVHDFGGPRTAISRASEPLSHVSFYEASAFAKWAGKRLPTEAEWELAAGQCAPVGNLFENSHWGTSPVGAYADPEGKGCSDMIGNVWEWTSSEYAPYPGFKSDFDEYNDKFFINQKVLRGGSFSTPSRHIRPTYRNFFYPQERWMTAGIRLAQSV